MCENKKIERWVDVKNHPKYEVSNVGNIRNKKTGRILKQHTNHNGYKTIQIDKTNKSLKGEVLW